MANYYCSARTNYFRVKDEKAFEAWVEQREVRLVRDPGQPGFFALLPDTEEGSFPKYDYGIEEEFDFVAELSKHLTEDSVAVLLETGAERLRYLVGQAIAVNAKGETIEVSLEDIYPLAEAQFGVKPTRAEY